MAVSIEPNAVMSTTGMDGCSRRSRWRSARPSSPPFMRMSLTMTSGRTAAIASSADSPLCANATAKPSWLNTSQSSSQVTRSSSTTVMRGRSRAMGDLHQGQAQAEPRAGGRGRVDVNGASLLRQDLAGDGEAEAAAVGLGRLQRLEQMRERVGRQAGTGVLHDHLDEAPRLVGAGDDLEAAAGRHCVDAVVHQGQEPVPETGGGGRDRRQTGADGGGDRGGPAAGRRRYGAQPV